MNEAKLQNKETLEESMRIEAARLFLSGTKAKIFYAETKPIGALACMRSRH